VRAVSAERCKATLGYILYFPCQRVMPWDVCTGLQPKLDSSVPALLAVAKPEQAKIYEEPVGPG
jgi:hypothetical protein